MDSSFFEYGACPDRSYSNVRDLPHLRDAKEFVEQLWRAYKPLRELNTRSNARTQFLQRFWEMYLAHALQERGMQLFRQEGGGPEFYFVEGGQRVWVEAIAPGPGESDDRVLAYGATQVMVPEEKVVLRLTNAVLTKFKKFECDRTKGLVGAEDRLLLAMNSREIPHAPFPADLPFFIRALLPFGPISLDIDRRSNRVVDSYLGSRPSIVKTSGTPIETSFFQDPKSQRLVAVLHSTVDWINRPHGMGADFELLHNPLCDSPLNPDQWQWCRQFTLAGNDLLVHERADDLPKRTERY